MNLIKRIFGTPKKTTAAIEPMRGTEPMQTAGERESVREKMEAEMVADREKRDAKASEGN